MNRKSLTLTELIIAIVLLGIVFLTATNLEISGRRFYIQSDRYTQAIMDIAPAMEKIEKTALLQIGDITNTGISLFPAGCVNNCNEVHIRRDYNAAGNPNNSPGDYADDRWVAFWRSNAPPNNCLPPNPAMATANDLLFCRNCQNQAISNGCNCAANDCQSLAKRIVAPAAGLEGFVVTSNANCGIDISITARFDPTNLADDNNPQVFLTSSACPRGTSRN